MKNIIFIALISILSLGIWWKGTFTQHSALPVIGVIQVVEHPALDQTRKGIFDELEANGFKDKIKINWMFESAQNNPALATQIAQKFIGQKAAALVTIGTTVSQSALQAIQQADSKTPLVFASVTNPLQAKLVASPTKNQPGVTGVSNYVPTKKQFQFFKKLLPNLKTLGIIYNPGEANSVALLKEMEEEGKKMDITIRTATASRTTDVGTAAQSLIHEVDAIFINNDNTALASFDSIVSCARLEKKPIFASDIDCVEKGAFGALGADQYQLGRQAGKMLVKILKDPNAVNTLPIEYPVVVLEKINSQ